MNYRTRAAQIASSKSESYWLKAAVIAANNRDPVDALHDAEKLLEFCRLKYAETLTMVQA